MNRLHWYVPVMAVIVAGAAVLTHLPRAQAVPVFARRYGTSCQTCHVVYPKLTPFGEAFRRNGHRFPDGQDEDYRRQEPQKLGADAYRDVFPHAVWPGEIPLQLPLSAVGMANAVARPEAATTSERVTLNGTAGVTAAASLGDWLSAWAGASVAVDSTGKTALALERAFLVLTPGKGPWGNLRVGLFEPGVFSFSSHRQLGVSPWILSSRVGDNQFAMEPTQLGVEWTGVNLDGRATFTAGVVEGAGNQVGPPTDVYGRFAAKLGGMRLDGVSNDGDAGMADPAPWREWSVLIGAFGYAGLATVGDPKTSTQNDRFGVVGMDVNAQLRDANVILAYSFGRNTRPILAEPTHAVDTHHLMAQLDYVVFPWLVPSFRMERRIISGNAEDRMMPSLYLLLRANVRTQVMAVLQRAPRGELNFDRMQAGVSVGF